MWLEKLAYGVLRLMTPLGPRYLRPSFGQRLYLLWVFRNFQSLPLKVLSGRQQKLIEALCEQDRFVSVGAGIDDAPLLGTLEQRPLVPSDQATRPNSSVTNPVAPFAADIHRQ